MNSVAVVLQARMGSQRRPYKISSLYKGKPLLYWQIQRLKLNEKVNKIIVVTTTDTLDDATEFIATSAGASVFRGDKDDVMKRYLDASREYNIDYIIRVCGDDPLVDPICIEKLHDEVIKDDFDIVTASHQEGWLLGTSAEAFPVNSLRKSYEESSIMEKEHVVVNFYNNQDRFKLKKLIPDNFYNDLSLTVDYQEDIDNVVDVLNHFGTYDFSHADLIRGLKEKAIKLSHVRTDHFVI